MNEQTKMLWNFIALLVMGMAFLYWALGIGEMTAMKTAEFIGKLFALTFALLIGCCVFVIMKEKWIKKK